EIDPHSLAKELRRIDDLVAKGLLDDALAGLDKLRKDPRSREGYVEVKPGTLAKRTLSSLEHEARARLFSLPEAAWPLYDARYEDEVARLADLARSGETWPLARLVSLYPLSARAPRAALELAERELERGSPEAAAARLETLLVELARRAT